MSYRCSCSLLVVLGTVLAEGGLAYGDYGLYFGGAEGAVEVSGLEKGLGAKGFTVECRVKLMSRVVRPVSLVSRWSNDKTAADKGNFSLGLRIGGGIVFQVRDSEGMGRMVTGRGKFMVGTWHHLAATWDGETARLYLDGVMVLSKKLEKFERLGETKLPLRVGPTDRGRPGGAMVLDGFVADVAFWSLVREGDSIKSGLGQPLDGRGRGLEVLATLRGEKSEVNLEVKGGVAKLLGGVKKVGWTVTPMWYEKDKHRPFVHVFDYDLSKVTGEASGSGSINNATRMIIVMNPAKKQAGVVWQHKDTRRVYVTWVGSRLEGDKTYRLEAMGNSRIVGATTDAKGNIYYMMVERVTKKRPETQAMKANMRSSTAEGKTIGKRAVNVAKKNGFNMFVYSGRWKSSLVYSKGMLCLILTRTMHKSSDGLNHQGAIAVTFSARSLKVLKNYGQTSGHSMGNILTLNTRGEFMAVDLGDNYPRGVHLHKISKAGLKSRVVFTFKTRHGTKPTNSKQVYKEISKGKTKFYKWSNDNEVYSELGGVLEGRKSYSVIFSADRSLEGKVLDNSRAFPGNKDPRDLVFMRIVKNFDRVKDTDNVMSDQLIAGRIKRSEVETGGFYDFRGKWKAQRLTGALWLTNYGKGERARRPQVATLKNRNILILWEKTTSGGSSLQAIEVKESGTVVKGPIDLGRSVRLNRQDLVMRVGSRLYFLGREGKRTKLLFVNDG